MRALEHAENAAWLRDVYAEAEATPVVCGSYDVAGRALDVLVVDKGRARSASGREYELVRNYLLSWAAAMLVRRPGELLH